VIFSNLASARNFPAKMMKKVAPGKNLSKFYLLLTLAQPPRGTAASEAERNERNGRCATAS
jgi:hypothetical protein